MIKIFVEFMFIYFYNRIAMEIVLELLLILIKKIKNVWINLDRTDILLFEGLDV